MTRNEAIARMRRALDEYIILGVKTTIPFHKSMMLSEHFREGKLHTHFVDEYRDEIMGHMKKIIKADEERAARLKSTFLPSPKIAAVSAAVNSYIANSNNKS